MGRPLGPLPKITKPTIQKSLARTRVFRLLDEAWERPLIWLSAPAGYGKTTAIATYLGARRLHALWYHCDEGDADVASFYYYLSMLFGSVVESKNAAGLAFSPEHFAAIPTYTRNFFRTWFALLPPGTNLVLDNWQDVPPQSVLASLLPTVAEEVPSGIRLIVVSRSAPSPALSRFETRELLSFIGTEHLQLSKEETAEIANLYEPGREQLDANRAEKLHALTSGWAAALAAVLRHTSVDPGQSWNLAQKPPQAIFNLLSTQVFERLERDVQEVLLKTACLDHISPSVARHVSGNERARSILEELVRQNAFITHRAASDTFHFHPLFREFLNVRLSTSMNAADRRALLAAAAASLSEQGDLEAAIDIYVEAQLWNEAAALIMRIAGVLVQQVRLQTLGAWIEAFPQTFVVDHSWLSYWLGIQHLATQMPLARPSLERAYSLFVKEKDALGQMLAAAAILQHINYSYSDYSPMAPWIDILDALLKTAPSFPSLSVELQVATGFMLALAQAQPVHPSLYASVNRVSDLVGSEVDLPSRAAGVAALLLFFGGVGRTAQYGDLDKHVWAVLSRQDLGPAARIHIIWMQAYQMHLSGDGAGACALLEEGRITAQHHNFAHEDLRLRLSQMQSKDFAENMDDLGAALVELEPVFLQAPQMMKAHFRYLQAMYYLACGQLDTARSYVEESNTIIAKSSWPLAHCLIRLGAAEVYCDLGRYEDALRCVSLCYDAIKGVDAPVLEFNGGLVRAQIFQRTHQHDKFAAELSTALSIGRRHGFANGFHAYSLLLPRLIPYALELGIEVSYCRWAILKRSIKPPCADIPHWPWPVRIRAMGALEIYLDEAAVEFQGKSKRKPIDLLKVLMSQSAGLETTRIMDLLWPDLEGDGARNAFDLALHRLRKILSGKDTILLTQGHLLINTRLIWVDAFVLERISAEGLGADLKRHVSTLLALYRAPFLADDDTPWIFSARERLRSQFIRSVAAVGAQLEQNDRWDLLVTLLRQAVEIEPLEEELYRNLIRALMSQGHIAEAEAVFARCEQSFLRLLQRRPSPSTRSLISRHLPR
ncbi:MAG: hypothetical protein QOK23_3039 [Gammaproteobacteria bacterium]|nr:hypothetical protein [Gammaproteobacteria bacterium]